LTLGRLAGTRASLEVSPLEQELLPESSLPEQRESLSTKPQLLAERQRARLPAVLPELAAAKEFPVRFRLASIRSPFHAHQDCPDSNPATPRN
jgi:hypothetical protein